MTRVVTFGEVMLRLKSPGFERLFQSPMLEATFGGAESNVAASLAQLGVDARFVSAIPANNIGDACIASLRSFGVDVSAIKRQGERLGVYFLENGSNQRPSRVTYDRSGSSISTAQVKDFDFDAIFDGADWFHISGVTPAISASAAELSLEAARGESEGHHGLVRLQLSQESLALRQGGARDHAATRCARDRRHRERRRLPESARH